MSEMKRGRTDAETAALNDWGVGTIVRGHEEWPNGAGVWTTWRITAIGETCVLARTIRSDYTNDSTMCAPDLRVGGEHTVTFTEREWAPVEFHCEICSSLTHDAAGHGTNNPPDDSAPVRDVRADEGASA